MVGGWVGGKKDMTGREMQGGLRMEKTEKDKKKKS